MKENGELVRSGSRESMRENRLTGMGTGVGGKVWEK